MVSPRVRIASPIRTNQNYSSIAAARKDHQTNVNLADASVKKRKLRFEDINNMNAKDIEKFKPEDLVDVDSQDSEHEILAKYKPRQNLLPVQQ